MYDEMKANNAEVLSVAIDLQGPEKARPYHDKANAKFTTVVDTTNHLGELLGFKAIPNGILVDEDGVVVFQKYSGFDIRKPEFSQAVESFVRTGRVDGAAEGAQAGGNNGVQTIDYFRRGLERLHAGDFEGAKKIWREGIEVEPDHWNMRKQLWALEHPEKFYDGDVDYAWQKEQIEKSA